MSTEDIDYRAAHGLEKIVIRGLAKDSQWVQNHVGVLHAGGCADPRSGAGTRRRKLTQSAPATGQGWTKTEDADSGRNAGPTSTKQMERYNYRLRLTYACAKGS